MANLRNKPAPPGWRSNRGSAYWAKTSQHGLWFKCKSCGGQRLGAPVPHRVGCPLAEPTPAQPERVQVEERALGNLLSFVVKVDGEMWARVPVWHDYEGRRLEAEARRRADLIAEGLRKVLP